MTGHRDSCVSEPEVAVVLTQAVVSSAPEPVRLATHTASVLLLALKTLIAITACVFVFLSSKGLYIFFSPNYKLVLLLLYCKIGKLPNSI